MVQDLHFFPGGNKLEGPRNLAFFFYNIGKCKTHMSVNIATVNNDHNLF